MDHNRRRSRTKKVPHPKHLPPSNDETVVITHMSRMAHNFRRIHVICMRCGDGNDDGGTQFFPNICIAVIECVNLFIRTIKFRFIFQSSPLVTSENEPLVSPSTSGGGPFIALHKSHTRTGHSFTTFTSAELAQHDRVIA
jgi:hypothetical protein